LLNQIRHKEVFGAGLGWVWTIKYQKRYLPHLHLLVFLRTEYPFLTAANIHGFISAELPPTDVAVSQKLIGIIEITMVHTHGVTQAEKALCMQGLDPMSVQTCQKGYPPTFQEETIINKDGYPTYRRRNTGQSLTITFKSNGADITAIVDNRRVVPYSPYLSLHYKAQINMEICGSVKAVKYIHKYIYKRGDCATVIINDEHDEIQHYLHGRSIGPTEAVWRLFEFSTHGEEPPVMHLALHLLNEQPIYFREEDHPLILRQHLDNSSSTLLAYFKYNFEKAHRRQYLYHEFLLHYVYIGKQGWKVRSRGRSIGHMYSASPFVGTQYYLRLLLALVRGATSFEHLRTVDGFVHTSCKEACIALCLLGHDSQWVAMFTDAKEFITGNALRHVFALALQHTTITNPLQIWQQFGNSFCDDLSNLLQMGCLIAPGDGKGMEGELSYNYGLYHIQQLLNEYGKSLAEFGLPEPVLDWRNIDGPGVRNTLVGGELGYEVDQQRELADRIMRQLNHEQVASFQAIVNAVESHEQELPQRAYQSAFFQHGPAGTGKTFLYKCLCRHLQPQGKIVLCVASSEIADS